MKVCLALGISLLIAAPAMYALGWAAAWIGTKVLLDAGLVAATVCLTLPGFFNGSRKGSGAASAGRRGYDRY